MLVALIVEAPAPIEESSSHARREKKRRASRASELVSLSSLIRRSQKEVFEQDRTVEPIAAKDLSYVRAVLNEIGEPPDGPTPMFIDSAGTYGYTRHQGAKQRTKYFELWVTYIRKAYTMNSISLFLITTETEVADALTKALPRGSLSKFRNYMMNVGTATG